MLFNIFDKFTFWTFLGELNNDDQIEFFLMATRRPYGVFTFESAQISNKTFKSLEYTPDKDLSNYQCLTAMYNPDSQKLDLFTTDCSEEYSIVCRKILVTKPDCTGVSKFQKKTTF